MSLAPRKVLVTGGAGFIGSAFVRYLISETDVAVINVDKLTYAGNLDSLKSVSGNERYSFHQVDICDGPALEKIFDLYRPDAVVHLAAESHVDRSIDSPAEFVRTNVVGTATLLGAAESYWSKLGPDERQSFCFLHVSTDEVFGELDSDGFFNEETAYKPNSPYAASKAAADHMARAWFRTYGLPVVISNCSNNFGPYQFPEKLIPLMILRASSGKSLPVYGTGANVRDWLYVDDHAAGLWKALTRGTPGRPYLFGGRSELSNLEVVQRICDLLDKKEAGSSSSPRSNLIAFVDDRPGHDFRYAVDCRRAEQELGWRPVESFETGLAKTVDWYMENAVWWKRIQDGSYRGERLGLGARSGKGPANSSERGAEQT